MRGYHREPAHPAFVDGWFHSGDLARQDADGLYEVVGRSKDMIISGGENIYPAEIENLLAGTPGVADCAVVGMPDARWGEVPVLAVVAAPGHAPDEAALRALFDARLARFKHPRRIVFLAGLPRTALGKVRKAELAAHLQPGRPCRPPHHRAGASSVGHAPARVCQRVPATGAGGVEIRARPHVPVSPERFPAMRLDKLATAFQQALNEASSLALTRDNPYVEPAHVLQAMLEQTDGPQGAAGALGRQRRRPAHGHGDGRGRAAERAGRQRPAGLARPGASCCRPPRRRPRGAATSSWPARCSCSPWPTRRPTWAASCAATASRARRSRRPSPPCAAAPRWTRPRPRASARR
jgi:fatty-acyl-CoA synthase